MATPVVTVASGGLAVIDVTATTPKLGLPVTEASNGRGIAVTKVAARGMPVTFSTVPDYPAGGGGGYSPVTALTGLIGWWDAQVFASMTMSGSNLTSMADQSGAGNNMVNNVYGGPAYNATGFNSRPSLTYSLGNGLGLRKTGFAFGTGNTLTVFAVGQMNSNAETYGRIISYTANGQTSDGDNNASFTVSRNSTTNAVVLYRNAVVASRAVSLATPFRVIATINSSGVQTIYIDGVATTGSTLNAAFGAVGTLILGGGYNDWDGIISEWGIATGFTNSTDVASLDTYLKNKWGL